MARKNESKVVEVVAPKSAVNQLMGLYIIVAFMLSLSWFLGSMSFSFLWVFGIIFGLFAVWRTRLKDIVQRNLEWHKQHFNRKRALRQEESAEWLNFVINRWWVFSSITIEDLVRRRINERLLDVKPTFIGHLELTGFTFGDITPSVRSIKAFECTDGVPGFKPASWSSVVHPPAGLEKMSAYQIVLEAEISTRCEDFRMVFRARAGRERVGLNFDIAVEELHIKGTLQLILHLSMEVPFPHVSKATVSFTDVPEVWFNVTVLKALQLMEIPLLKSWIHINVMEGITKALVDPGKIDVPIATTGPVNAQQIASISKPKLAEGVLTIYLKGTPSLNAGEEIHYTRLEIGSSKRQTSEVLAVHPWEDYCSFFVHDLQKEKLNIKRKCKRLLTSITLEQHDLELSSFPFNLTKQIEHEIENNDGSKLSLSMDYSPLPPINLHEEEPVSMLQRSGVLYVCVHCANNVIASDKTGSSDPYCVVFCNRRRVLTTPYISQNRNPSWQSQTEFFVLDYAQCELAFYVFDWDGTNQIDDDFLGSAMFSMSEKEPCVLNKALTLGYNKQGEGHLSDGSLGQIYVSIIFRPVPSVEKSERYRLTSTDSVNNNNNNEFLYIEDMVSPGTRNVTDHVQKSKADSKKFKKHQSTSGKDEDFLKDKIFVDLTIIQAKELIPMDRNGYSDPYCVVKMGDTKLFSTSVKKKTLSPTWNETVTLQVDENCSMLDIELYDKDVMFHDFLGKVSLTLDQLKEISLRGCADWFPLQHVKSGHLQITCTVIAAENMRQHKRGSIAQPRPENVNNDIKPRRDTARPSPERMTSTESDVFVTPASKLNETPLVDQNNHHVETQQNNLIVNRMVPSTSTPLKNSPIPEELAESPVKSSLKRSASDLNVERRNSKSNSLNSFAAFPDSDFSSDWHVDRMYNVTGKVLSVQGLKFREGTIYCKVRVITPHKHRLRQIFGNRVIAKSAMVKASQPTLNLPIDLDRGMGISGETLLKFDVKREGKEHLASKAFTVRSLFAGPGGEADKIQKVLPLENNVQVEVYLEHSPVDEGTFLRRRHGRSSGITRSFRKSVV